MSPANASSNESGDNSMSVDPDTTESYGPLGSPSSTRSSAFTSVSRTTAVESGSPSEQWRQPHRASVSRPTAAEEISASGDAHPTSRSSRRNAQKVSRACDFCKRRKARCSGTLPCAKCTRKGLVCHYDSKYSRGRPPTPPPSKALTTDCINQAATKTAGESREQISPSNREIESDSGRMAPPNHGNHASAGDAQTDASCGNDNGHQTNSRASPELGMAEIEGQVFDPTSGVTYLHKAWRRLSKGGENVVIPPGSQGYPRNEHQPLMLAGDLPLPPASDEDLARLVLRPFDEAQKLISFYYEVCIVTYRIIHRPSLESWLSIVLQNIQQARPLWDQIGRARAAILIAVLAIAVAHEEKRSPAAAQRYEGANIVGRSDHLFAVSVKLTDDETGLPRLESAQARVIQTFYLLLSSRMNRAWYTFGNTLQIISALGLHRKSPNKLPSTPSSGDYIQSQMCIRTFWTTYILDKYLGVILGRPRHYHDDDIDQAYPDRIDDEDMSPQGPLRSEYTDSHVDALIYHAKIARIIGAISREVYSIKPITEQERYAAAHRLSQELRDWKQSLPPYLGSVRPSMLIRSLRRQSQVLQVAYSHGMMHANRLFLLGNPTFDRETQILECVGAARTVLELFDRMADEGPTFQAFWWTHYVAFQALVICYVWDIQRKRWRIAVEDETKHAQLMAMADRCQTHLAHATAKNSPSRRYAVILEIFRSEALGHKSKQTSDGPEYRHDSQLPTQGYQHQQVGSNIPMDSDMNVGVAYTGQDMHFMGSENDVFGPSLLDQWQTTDWLDLDASAFGLYVEPEPDYSQWTTNLMSST